MRKVVGTLLVAVTAALLPLPAAAQSARSLTVVFKSATLPPDAETIVSVAGGTVVNQIPEIGVMTIVGPPSLIDTLGGNAAIAAIGPELQARQPQTHAVPLVKNRRAAVNTSTATYYNLFQWDIKQVTGDGASFNVWAGSHGTVVGLIDTGVSTQHPALKGNLLGGRNFVPDGPNGTVVPTDIEDRNGHGSHTAGSVAGNGLILGVGPDLGFRSYRVFGATGGSPSSRIMNAMVTATNDGVDVISMSIGGYDVIATWWWIDPDTGIRYRGLSDVADFIAYRRAVAYANGRGVVVVAAAGNEGINISSPTAITAYLNSVYGPDGYVFQGASREVPGTLSGVLTVSATGPDKSIASYSNYGSGAIDVTAPGGDYERYPVGDWYTDMCLGADMDSGYVWMAGTSMATPKVAAVAALIIDKAKAEGITLTPQQVVAAVQQTSIDIGKPGYDLLFGNGFVSALNAVSK